MSSIPKFRPHLPEEARKKIKTGGAHANKKAHNRSLEKRDFNRQVKDFK
jgi:hypothetical protein